MIDRVHAMLLTRSRGVGVGVGGVGVGGVDTCHEASTRGKFDRITDKVANDLKKKPPQPQHDNDDDDQRNNHDTTRQKRSQERKCLA